ncbi:MAG: hypothetical protein A2927_01595 [Candidatus Komeilibacteria bacterium RIFCSPLOWO2_01_FULL_45_10]|uniref:Divalent-cation tolerance protein CutA n=1 Tax=Candidatus Komeilibacteria bacterium RIFCSPLOWO2_01_FULL_45_10 TaxID=1798550 RepID=A0A1G2BI65_9BACT|nr:MAG: hypothetical protein A2927_01595 [Candidatus Komeilibacteria bacterium RIFCSPLOWO2_01_FULL_45_10]
MILIYTICRNKSEAEKIAAMLLKLRLIACANWWPMESIYRWKNKITTGQETVMILKTRENYYKRIESIIKKIHSDEVPCILKIKVNGVQSKYLEWLRKETRVV